MRARKLCETQTLLVVFWLVLPGLVSGCGASVDFTAPLKNKTSLNGVWAGPYAADLGAAGPGFLKYNAGTKKSFADFRMSSNSSLGGLVGTFYDGTFFRATGHTYVPRLSGGSGWGSSGGEFTFLDSGVANVLQATLGSIGANGFLAGFSSGASVQSAALGTAGSWGAFNSTVATQAPLAIEPAYGFASGAASDSAGQAYLGYIAPGQEAFFQHYSPFTVWDSGAGTPLAPAANQLDLIGNGYDALAVWTEGPRIVAGGNHTCVTGAGGTISCWGGNGFGEMGNGTSSASQLTPVTVTLPAPAVQLSAGANHACALTSKGDVYCWGRNDFGQLGDNQNSGMQCGGGTVFCSLSPVLVALGTTASAISSGDHHNCAVILGGGLKCWGKDDQGQLGDNQASGLSCVGGTVNCSKVPVLIALNAGAKAQSVALGASHSCAVTTAGDMQCFGTNANGETGNGNTTTPQKTPVSSVLGGTKVLYASGGGNHTCAVTSVNAVICWGLNTTGQVGTGNTVSPQLAPVTVNLGGGILATQVTLGAQHSCAMTSAGVVRCWGLNADAETGNGGTVSPQTTSPGFALTSFLGGTAVTAISSHNKHTCAATSAPAVFCWGLNDVGELGDNQASGKNCVGGTEFCGLTPQASLATSGFGLRSASPASPAVNWTAALSSDDVKSFSLASDGAGTAVAVFIQRNPGNPPCTNNPNPTTACNYRVFASVRGLNGNWVGPTQLDSNLALDTSSVFQEAGGTSYYTPGVAYVGSGQFVAVFSVINSATTPRTAGLYSRTYTVGSGWDPRVTTIEEIPLTTTAQQIRMANDLRLVGDGAQYAMLVSQYVVPTPDLSLPSTRSYGFQIYRFVRGSGWGLPTLFSGTQLCNVTLGSGVDQNSCAKLPLGGAIFPSGESVIVYPVPDLNSLGNFKLNSMESVP